ncbi:MAG TPA: hypothetical protein VEC01_07075 [Noviherbaspirillum sp.]|uniref:hypothetical protein n=1 Tax=Noviherbaspirillum sp. TaxID=1926288 RepID=UPI002D740DC6|nr:hypothetical protein [Noviherbaspirillum sp.]HYD95068.1 hypothetical protein [Noviherbaspirillum sp.]
MTARPLLLAAVLLSLWSGGAGAQTPGAESARKGLTADEAATQDGDWIGYRDAYMQMIRFEKYGKPKQLLLHHFQVSPAEKGTPMEGVRLILSGSSMQLNLPLDAAGRAVFPLLKSAYDENARLMLNRRGNHYLMQPRVSIAPRANGSYDSADLRAACEQALNYLRYIGKPGMQDKSCAGVRFSFPAAAGDPVVRFRSAEQAAAPLSSETGSAFQDDRTTFRIVDFHFSDWPQKGQVVTQGSPVAIAPLFR